MPITRRDLLVNSAATGALFAMPTSARAQQAEGVLETRKSLVQLAPSEYPKTEVWGYNGKNPGPEIRVQQGQRVQRVLRNQLPQPTSIHWHGIRIDNKMDGVAGLTQTAVKVGDDFAYDFVAPDAGTYWYHAHNQSTEQVGRGLYGPLIVEELDGPDVDQDQTLVLDDWLLDTQTAQIDADFHAPHNSSHAGRNGNLISTNGQLKLSLQVRKGERLRLRLINAANARIFSLNVSGFRAWVVALDGMPLEEPQLLSDQIFLGPAQRVDLIADVTAPVGETAHLLRNQNQKGFSQVAFPVSGDPQVQRRSAPEPLPANPVPVLGDLSSAITTRLTMSGGAMGRMKSAVFEGERKSFRDLASANQYWAFNDTVGMSDVPLIDVQQGQNIRLEIVNDTVFPHAMHLHGMHFREVLADGSFGPLRDTLLSFSGQSREIAFVADNPGDWLLHCHMLSHASSGMMTWIKVTA